MLTTHMGQIQAFAVAFLTSLALLPTVLAAELCQANQSCWPSVDAWSTFNTSIGGQLVAPHPPGWACHDPNYDEIACNDFKANWNSSFWRANQTGAMQNPIWDSLQCSFGSPRDETCDQGFVPYYSVDAQSDIHVIEAVKFADSLGRSSGAEGSFSIWTHNLRGIDFTNSFVASGCSQNETALPAVTVKAAEQWLEALSDFAEYSLCEDGTKRSLDVYKAADAHNVSVVGATARSVGAAGGWVQGGGHSMLSGLFGMGVDNVLQFTLVKPDGQTVLVALDVTYKTHPPVNVNVVRMILNATNAGKIAELSEVILGALPGITDQGIRGYGVWGPPTSLMVLLIHPNILVFLSGTRLVSREAFAKNSKELLKYIWGDGKRLGANFNIIGGGAVSRVDPELTSWAANASAEEIEQIKSDTTQIVQRFSEVAGLDDAAYFNEADPWVPPLFLIISPDA
ncbi:oxygen-dependent FAD-linked oxidoreductase family [Rhizoctonia solani]|uniref:Oxygen-dependent FAD-linked oxidoreductase family n=1 Tax=Rhizoctonia solani TaxID=456999 RepID=A0A8H7I420_9AGAM|nr:oxygen-dependent FAD-linked oxidoreductase family [Rhizoctonia solani]